SHQHLTEQLLAAAGVTGSLTASQQALASRLAALQLAAKQQRLARQAAEAEAVGGTAEDGRAAGPLAGPADSGEGVFWPTCMSDVCMIGDIASLRCSNE
ncbi:hypothetical protein MNEG_11786, partial [Monoraphidium neglectum]